MARPKAEGKSKSAHIRDVQAAFPNYTAKEVVEALKKQGIEVNEGLVYQAKRTMGKKTKGRRGRKPGSKTVAQSRKVSIGDMLHEVKALAAKVGGLDELAKIVSALRE